jgi:predicted RNase H-like HicB family nuclease
MAVKYYRATFVPAATGFSVAFPDFMGCVSYGEDLQHAAAQAEAALSLHLETMIEDGDPIPEPSQLGAPLPDWMAEDYAAEGTRYSESLVRAELPGKAMRVNMTMTEDVLAAMDRTAQRRGMSRSGYVAHLVREDARRESAAA